MLGLLPQRSQNRAKGSIPACITLQIMSERQEMLEKLLLCCKDVPTCGETYLVTLTVLLTRFHQKSNYFILMLQSTINMRQKLSYPIQVDQERDLYCF